MLLHCCCLHLFAMPSEGHGQLCAGAPRDREQAEHVLERESMPENRRESIFPINGVMGEIAQIGQLKYCQKKGPACLLPLIFILQQKLSKTIWYY